MSEANMWKTTKLVEAWQALDPGIGQVQDRDELEALGRAALAAPQRRTAIRVTPQTDAVGPGGPAPTHIAVGSARWYQAEVAWMLGCAAGYVEVSVYAPGSVRILLPANTSDARVRRVEAFIRETSMSGAAFIVERRQADREAQRREIDAMLAEDARLHPAFATARRAAVMADVETPEHGRPPVRGRLCVKRLLRELHRYEDARGGGRVPSREAAAMLTDEALAVYERVRGCR